MSLVKELLPKVLLLKMYIVVLDANAAEHAARTVAMQVASDNAQDLISELTLAYNKGRQQEITAEILDLIGGTMA
jgi:F-type H+-transporting ATPase subunit gamma